MIKKTYYWKDKNGQAKQSEGIELEDHEKAALCKENLNAVRNQLGKENTAEHGLSEMDRGKVLEFHQERAQK